MNEEKFKEIIRAVIDEKTDKTALGKIRYACEQQICHIESVEDEYDEYRRWNKWTMVKSWRTNKQSDLLRTGD